MPLTPKNLLTSNEDKNILLLWSNQSQKLSLYNTKLLQKRENFQTGQELPSEKALICRYGQNQENSSKSKFDIFNLSLNESGDWLLMSSENCLYLVKLILPAGNDLSGPVETTFSPKKLIQVRDSSTFISKPIWISKNRFALLQNFKIKIYDNDNLIQSIELSEDHKLNLFKNQNAGTSKPSTNKAHVDLIFSIELNGFIFLNTPTDASDASGGSDNGTKILLYKLNSFNQNLPISYKLVPKIAPNLLSNCKMTVLNWCGQTILSCCYDKTITHICLVDDEDDDSQRSQDNKIGDTDPDNLIFWAYESLNLEDNMSIEEIFLDELVTNRYYITTKGNIYSVTLPVGVDSDEELPVADIQHIFQNNAGSISNSVDSGAGQFINGFTTSLNKIFCIILGKFYLLPKVSFNGKELQKFAGTKSSENDTNITKNQADIDFRQEISKILKREKSQPILSSSSPSDNPLEISRLLRSSINLIKTEYLDKQKLASHSIQTQQNSLLSKIDLMKQSNNSIQSNQKKLILNAERIADKINTFCEKQEDFDRKIKKIRQFNWAGEDLSRSERAWLENAEKIQERIYQYKIQIGDFKLRLDEQNKDQTDNYNIDETNMSVSSTTSTKSSVKRSPFERKSSQQLRNSLQYSEIEGNLVKNTNDLEKLVSSLKGLSIQASGF